MPPARPHELREVRLTDDVVTRIAKRSNASLPVALLEAARRHRGPREVLIDGDGRALSYRDILRGVFGLGHAVARTTRPGEKVGILLPTGAGAVVTFYAVLAYGRIPAMLNFTAGRRALESACRTAEVKKVLTARRFVDAANLQQLVDELSRSVEIVHLEDVRAALTLSDKLAGATGPMLPRLYLARSAPDDPAVVLFTSGTEGEPKGVVLSHRNILANIAQADEHLPILPDDVFFNPLPTFHSYGLTAGTLLPLTLGRRVVLHPSPLQAKVISQRIHETQATILFATDTFLRQYARAGDPGSLSSLRYAVCGAERVRPETREYVRERFGFVVIEGYGVTETAPVLAANHPDDIQDGTVGRLFPGIEARIEPVEGMAGRGRLHVRGPNIMLGYLTPDRPGEIQKLPEGWHDTGDVVSIDEEGYVTIHGRMKRFAKIGGEMVPLAMVENCAASLWPEHLHTAAVVPAPRKGEQIVLLTEHEGASVAELLAFARERGLPELAVPKLILTVDRIPVLGTGKIAHAAVDALVRERLAAMEAFSAEPPADDATPTQTEAPGGPAAAARRA